MLKLETQSAELQNCMYHSVTHNFDRVSGLHDNGLTSFQMQDGDKIVEVTAPENAIDDDVINIIIIYPLWSTDTDDLNDVDHMTNYNSIVRSNLAIHCSDTPFIIWQPICRPCLLERVYKPIHIPHWCGDLWSLL